MSKPASGRELKFAMFRQVVSDATEADLKYVEVLVQARRNKLVEEEQARARAQAEMEKIRAEQREASYKAYVKWEKSLTAPSKGAAKS